MRYWGGVPYYFGLYHWRRRGRQLLVAAALLVAGVVAWRKNTPLTRLVGIGLVGLGIYQGKTPVSRTLDPPPWHIDEPKYRRLAAGMKFDSATNAVDVGTGTGRSLVGMAPDIPETCAVTAVDVFDDRVILGNGPSLTRRNTARAGLSPRILRGDAAALPFAPDSQDVVTFCRVLHDLPDEATADAALTEAARILDTGGRLGVMELPVTHADAADPEQYWRTRIDAAGFTVDHTEWHDQYLVIHASLD